MKEETARRGPHFTPPGGWMNDPNGLLYFEGEWHLFYQYLPEGGAGGKHWGHAVSRDLVSWEDLPIAIAPDEHGDIWSGSCVADPLDTSGFFGRGGGLVAFFTHHRDSPEPGGQVQSMAYSRNRGRTWTKYGGNPVLRATKQDFRDPKVFWHEETKGWVMVLAASACVEVYRSSDLKTWTFASEFGRGLVAGRVWECPDLFSLRDEAGDEVWLLVASSLTQDNFEGKVGACEVHYVAGKFDGYAFAATTHLRRLSFGPDDYAAVTFADAPGGRRVLLGWQNHWGYSWHPGQMTLPRELRWDRAADGLVQALPVEVDEAGTWPRTTFDDGSGVGVTFASTPWEVTIPEQPTSWRMEARQGGDLIFSLARDGGAGEWVLRRADASFPKEWETKKEGLRAIFTAPHRAPATVSAGGRHRVIVDQNSLEVFGDDGHVYYSAQLFPPGGAWEVTLSGASEGCHK